MELINLDWKVLGLTKDLNDSNGCPTLPAAPTNVTNIQAAHNFMLDNQMQIKKFRKRSIECFVNDNVQCEYDNNYFIRVFHADSVLHFESV